MKLLTIAVFSLLITANLASGQSSTPELWYWQNAYPESLADVNAIETRMDQALTYGYTGVALWSTSFTLMGSTVIPANNVAYMQDLVSYARSKGLKTIITTAPYGYSDDALLNNPNWAEGQHITGSNFVVNASRTALIPTNTFGGLLNPGFEAGRTGWFDWDDPNMGIDTTTAHTGAASGYITNATGNSRFVETLNVTPWRQYHGKVWVKTSGFSGYVQLEVWDPATGLTLFNAPITQQANQDWTALDFTFNSRSTTQPLFLFGVWGGSSGTIRFDDVLIEETSLVYVLRRPGTPLTVYQSGNPAATFKEGKDFKAIADPQLASGAGFRGYYHAPAVVTLPSGTSLQAGQKVAMDYYAVQPAQAIGDVGLCLSEPAVQEWMHSNAKAIAANFPTGVNYLLSYDEMRHMDSCAVCKAKNLTPAQLLASHVTSTYNSYRSLAPSAEFYIWSDMFDPYHNAVNNYYFVEGNIAGSWTGLPSKLTIMNWNLSNLTNSLTWFSGLNPQQSTHYNQLIAGYYDSGDGAGSATQEVQQAAGIPGVTGLMYTTWNNDFSQLQAFASAAKSHWAGYLSTVTTNVTASFSIAPSAISSNWTTGRYTQTVKLTNQGAALSQAAFVLDSLPPGVALYQPAGETNAALPAGSPYKQIGAIGAGASTTLTLQFTKTGSQAITYTPRILGAGLR